MKYLFRTWAHPPTAPGASRSEVSVFFSRARRFFLHSGFHPIPRTLRARLASSWGSASREQSATRLPLAGVRRPSSPGTAAAGLPPGCCHQTTLHRRFPVRVLHVASPDVAGKRHVVSLFVWRKEVFEGCCTYYRIPFIITVLLSIAIFFPSFLATSIECRKVSYPSWQLNTYFQF